MAALFLFSIFAITMRRGSLKTRFDSPPSCPSELDEEPSRARARFGGGALKRGREDVDAAESENRTCSGPHYEQLKRQWAKGDLTSTQVQLLAESAQQSGAIGVERIAKAGTSGKFEGNLYRDIKHTFG
eukprot:9468730-Pyramimonas_sp.AAC.1